jgi:Transposase
MEATGIYWRPVWHVLEGDCDLLLANAMHSKNVSGHKRDVNDAMWIADMLAHGLIRGSFVPTTSVQALRTLTHTRKQLVRERVPSVCASIVAVAASILTAVYYMLTRGSDYHDLGLAHLDQTHRRLAARQFVRKLGDLGFQVDLRDAAGLLRKPLEDVSR